MHIIATIKAIIANTLLQLHFFGWSDFSLGLFWDLFSLLILSSFILLKPVLRSLSIRK